MKLVNLTHKVIRVFDIYGTEVLTLQPSGLVVNCNIECKIVEKITHDDGKVFDLVTYEYDDTTTMPEPEAGTMFVVSFAVLQSLKGSRQDVIAPDTSPGAVVRDPGGHGVLGVRKFRRLDQF